MKPGQEHLRRTLAGALKELNRLSDQIRETKDYSQHAEGILCLREFVLEQQVEGTLIENPSSPNHTIR